jgi:HD superfamily phosphohydrolase
VLESHEFKRLNHLRQAGFSWLVYPSATHTRYAHSLGCWYLGEQALDSVRVLVPASLDQFAEGQFLRPFLIDWLRSCDLQEEFMTALLLHDIGHFPFSHVFEESPHYGHMRHEEVGAQYILGKGEVCDAFRGRINRVTKAYESAAPVYLSDALEGLSSSVLNRGIVCTLITGDDTYMAGEPEDRQKKVRVLKQLISGAIDLDRVDHYHRDSFSMGLRIGYVNPIALLVGMELCAGAEGDQCWIRLSDTGAMQALALLNTRDMLLRHVFDHPENAAYSQMLNCAVKLLIDERPEARLDLLTMTDTELLRHLLDNNASGAASKLAARILLGFPYTRVGRYRIKKPQHNTTEYIDAVRVRLVEHLKASGFAPEDEDVLIRVSRAVTRGRIVRTAWKEWLDMDTLQNTDGLPLSETELYQRQIRYLSEQFEDYEGCIEVFAANQTQAGSLRAFLREANYASLLSE